ncbi:MAG TPA: FecR domain-containing protein [Chitinophaga sp.]|uniref:FecR family protein n=1 Tax=Chitinophaga sp. TaxID=1869181 RepID=UPI002BDC3C7E|nr:FecR domain-containing protein [Chitinophaga sp.]HVI49557.1 FecR domain-containing protein [Chitinophaga sp.]
MDHNDTYIYELIAKQLSGSSSDAEAAELQEWLNASPENQATYTSLKQIWQDAPGAYQSQKQYNTTAAWQKVSSVVHPGVQDQAPIRTKVRRLGFKYAAAAAVLILLSAAAWWLASRPSTAKIQEVAANDGKIKSLKLADKTTVTLRQGSRIKYSEDFSNGDRIVELEGVAFFEVADDPSHPFVVKTPNQSVVEVLGTSFTVETGDSSTTVIVTSGKVKLGTHDDPNAVILASGQKGVWGNGQVITNSNDDVNFMSWKTGILQFNDQSLVEILPQLADFYGKVIRIDDAYTGTAAQRKATITFHDQSCDEVLHELQLLLGFNYKQEGDTIVISQ